ncbi:hypothetical protein L198_08066 [Cryptococcus wingfieldii CBS 7118]|uniref:BRCT domain-containing protein n=1 Tax=Cryptococcus wingfieldii CBS 7118 TaxID=1295528 RepID=A0A1E3HM04_9TREE|nr:hypothetical protein L198_08066 [Cryptococcus wingfieldii CBS 7118]ODN76471.1 hypothetical protein L198_08066 [Cryptococcus wingfieldii CBS 7118]
MRASPHSSTTPAQNSYTSEEGHGMYGRERSRAYSEHPTPRGGKGGGSRRQREREWDGDAAYYPDDDRRSRRRGDRDRGREREWQRDAWDQEREREGGRGGAGFDPDGPMSGVNAIRPRGSTGGGGNLSVGPLLRGVGLYLTTDLMDLRENRAVLLGTVKSMAGTAIADALHTRVQVVVVNIDPDWPTNLCLLVQADDTDTFDVCKEYNNWTTSNAIRHLAQVVGDLREGEVKWRKRVVRKEWLSACRDSGMYLGEKEGFGGWEVKATWDPHLASRPNEPYAGEDGEHQNDEYHPGERENVQGVDDLHADNNGNASPSRLPLDIPDRLLSMAQPRPPLDPSPTKPFDPRIKINGTEPYPSPQDSAYLPRATLPPAGSPINIRRPAPQLSEALSGLMAAPLPVLNGGLGNGHGPPSRAGTATGSAVGSVGSGTVGTRKEGLFVIGGMVPLTFFMVEPSRAVEIMIKTLGAGIITLPHVAQIHLFPIPRLTAPQNPDHVSALEALRGDEGKVAVSQEWVLDCCERMEVLPMEAYLVR